MNKSLFKKDNFIMLTLLKICVVPAVFIFRFPDTVSAGVKEGLKLCGDVMIPSMFPFLILSSFLLLSGAVDFTGNILHPFFRKIFNLSGKSGSIFLISLFSGFPVGARLVNSSLKSGGISRYEAGRLMMCCVNPGPAFVITAVGSSMLRSSRAGIIIFVSLSLSAVIMLFFSRLFFDRETIPTEKIIFKKPVLSSAFVDSVTQGTYSMLYICAFIILFSCICKGLESFSVLKPAVKYIEMLLEVSLGSRFAAQSGKLPLVAAVVGWGGICVHMQVFSAVIESKMKKSLFFLSRAVNSALSFLLCKILLYFFPCPLEVFSSTSQSLTDNFSAGFPAALGLVLMSAILLTNMEEVRKGQISKKLKNKEI